MNDERSVDASKDLKTLFTPFRIGSHEVKNRIVSTAHAMGWDPGLLTDRHVEYLERKAAGGAGLIMTFGSATVYKHSSASYGSISLWDPENEPALTDLANRVHAHGAKIISQATHMGRRGDSSVSGQPLQAPSAIPEGVHREIPHVLRQDEIPPIVEAFADAAARLERCGWDGIELEGFSGHLIEQFWSPATNKRTDRYGGDLTGRMRFSVEVIEAVAAAVSDDFLIVMRMTGDPVTDDLELTKEDLVEIAQRLEKLGHIDLFHISGGNAVTYAGQSAVVPGDTFARGLYNQAAHRMKANLSTPVLVAGRNLDPSQAEEALQHEDADLVGMTRAIIADPDLPRKAEEGRMSHIRPAIALTEDTIGRLYSGKPVISAVNPAVADPSLDDFEMAETKRRVVVVGAGPAGMEAARVATIRGHDVILLEASGHFGGQVATGSVASERPHYGRHINWLGQEFERYQIDMRLNSKADAEEVVNLNPDVIILATGSTAEIPSEAKDVKTRCTTDVEILDGNVSISPGSNVLVYDRESKFRGASIAKYAAEAGASQVEIVSPLWSVCEDLDEMQKPEMYRLLAENNVKRTANTRLAGEQDGYLLLEDVWSGEKRRMDDVDLAVFVGYQEADDSLYDQLKKTAPELDVQLIGDAIAPRRMSDAISEGVRAGSTL